LNISNSFSKGVMFFSLKTPKDQPFMGIELKIFIDLILTK